MSLRKSAIVLVVCVLFFVGPAFCWGGEVPNVLIVIADDATYSDLPLWGGENVNMPNLDRLASEGLVFDQAYLTMAIVPALPNGDVHGSVPGAQRRMLEPLGGQARHEKRLPLPGRNGLPRRHRRQDPCDAQVELSLSRWSTASSAACVSPTAKYECSGIQEFMGRDADQPFLPGRGLGRAPRGVDGGRSQPLRSEGSETPA